MTTESAPAPFWRTKSLAEMTETEWESLCDGCGKCCLHKIEDEDTEEILFTDVACRLLDIGRCRCSRYAERAVLIPECLDLRHGFDQWQWLPVTCAYRLLAQGGELPSWHPLVCGNAELVHVVGASVRDFAVPESEAVLLEDHVIEWLE
ncbi:YcgN family cysteine cluster protein [Methylogaea oryzae]|uniref:UPF0260 protein MoryE10_14260 n=1 Tax=Methylogaea oryzae TaxID=1295382 RepID=A0A8D4VMY3_9GAMM|nr:YcgN family cysteine cluster protein [Methylogaea oryzae]BBL70820.1 UPF0260 protein [Methylogaea oryzae]